MNDDGTGANPELAIVSPEEARTITVAEVLRRDGRFSQFRKLAEETATAITPSFMEAWDRPHNRSGDEIWITLFVPTNTAFAVLDPAVSTAWREGRLSNGIRYGWLGHHGFDRAIPSPEFIEGVQTADRGQPPEIGLDPLTFDGCPILAPDLMASNGYINIVGVVGVPDEVREASESP